MRLKVSVVFGALVLALLAVPGAPASSKATYYLSLGDSLAQGFQPIGGPLSPESPPGYNQGYADQLFKLTRDRYEQLREVKLGCGGETTTTLRFGGICAYEEGSQLAEAVAFLQENAGQIAFVTIDIGPNDLFTGAPGAIVVNLPVILTALRAAAGPDVPIIGMNFYDPFLPGAWAQGGLAQPPLNVLRECEWTWACARPPVGFDIHANTDGYGVIAVAFEGVLAP